MGFLLVEGNLRGRGEIMSDTNTPGVGGSLLGPDVNPATLFQLTQERPDLWVQIIEHPNTYPALLDWFKNVNQPHVKEALARRLGQSAPLPATPRAPLPATPRAPLPATRPAPLPATPTPKLDSTPISPFQPRSTLKEPKVEDGDGRPSGSVSKIEPGQLDEAPDDRTVFAKRRTIVYGDLLFGETIVPLTRKEVVLGRKAPVEPQSATVQAVTIPDPTKTISGKHAKLTFEDGVWNIEDLGSTNGIYLVNDSGEETLAVGKTKLDSSFYLGDVRFSVRVKQA